MNLRLEFPNESHKEMYEKMVLEWWEMEKIPIDPERLFTWNNYQEFLDTIIQDITNSDLWVNAHLFFLVNDTEILWALQIRHHINTPNLLENWWHIGYGIAPKHRRKWYATQMLKLWLLEAKKLWLDKVMISCNIDNVWSRKVIENNSWVFERFNKDWDLRRYWIDINNN